MSDLWQGIRPSARQTLATRNYTEKPPHNFPETALELAGLDRRSPEVRPFWIPAVEIFRRRVFSQRFRGWFSELARAEEGICGELGFWPTQWSIARMFGGTAKGFHIHPPHVPEEIAPADWMHRLYRDDGFDPKQRPYSKEQWDLMFITTGSVEMLLVDERAGLPRRQMRFFVEAGGEFNADSVGVLIPPGVAHAVRVEGSNDAVMVYGTTTTFDPLNEGRLESGVERCFLPSEWANYLEDPES